MLPIPMVQEHPYLPGAKLSRASGNSRDPVREGVLGHIRRPETVCRCNRVKKNALMFIDGADVCPRSLAVSEYLDGWVKQHTPELSRELTVRLPPVHSLW